MPRASLGGLQDQTFDTVVVGGGCNGASAAHHLAAAGYRVLLVDKNDFGAGSTSRSGRMLACGIRYLEPGDGLSYMVGGRTSPLWQFIRNPGEFLTGARKARDAMAVRAHFVSTMPERVEGNTWFYPVWEGDKYAPWQVGLGFRILRAISTKEVPLDYHQVVPANIGQTPLVKWLRNPEKLRSVIGFREYRFEWPERIVMDTVLDAERMGAVIRNYTEVVAIKRDGTNWAVTLSDTVIETGTVTVRTKSVVNTAGIWTDKVNRLANPKVSRKIRGTKGAHIMVQLPPECRTYGIIASSRDGNPLYIYPWRGMHYVGPTDTLFDGDEDDVYATGQEIDFLLDEANHLLPSIALARKDVLFTWAGVRPQTYDVNIAAGKRWRKLHHLADEGMPNVFNLTAGNIMTHRLAGREICAEVMKHTRASGRKQEISYKAKPYPRAGVSAALLNHWPEAKLSDLRHAAVHEHVVCLRDLMFRRVGAAWTATMGREAARRAAETVADILGWDEARIEAEVADYLAHIGHLNSVRPGGRPS
ncbi:MAG: FAD-dependent oxidoreductase [Alphaproteobacteria bacterium]